MAEALLEHWHVRRRVAGSPDESRCQGLLLKIPMPDAQVQVILSATGSMACSAARPVRPIDLNARHCNPYTLQQYTCPNIPLIRSPPAGTVEPKTCWAGSARLGAASWCES